MTPADLVAVATIGSTLQILTDFTSEQGTGSQPCWRSSRPPTARRSRRLTRARRPPTRPQRRRPTTRRPPTSSAQELDTFNNDVRLRALKTLAEALAPIQQKKAILYFSSGMQRNGTDNQVELRAAVNAAVRANVAIYPGRLPRAAGHRARRQRAAGQPRRPQRVHRIGRRAAVHAARGAAGNADDAGGRHRRHGVSPTPTTSARRSARSTKDISSYYILGFASTNTDKDGRFRRITVRLRNKSDVEGRGARGLLRRPRLHAHRERRSRSPAAGTAGDADSGDRRAAVRHRGMVPARGGQVLRAGLAGRAGLGRAAVAKDDKIDARRRGLHPRRARTCRSDASATR